MDWNWTKNGKRFRVLKDEYSKRRRADLDVCMDDHGINSVRNQMLAKFEREFARYKQQVKEFQYNHCCKKD
jgi:hypothetical protein